MNILFEDAHIMIVHKPTGLAVQSARVGQADLVSQLKKHLAAATPGKAPYLGVIHRLDQPVEGLLVFAKTPKAAAALTKQLQTEGLGKEYLAAVCGKPVKETDTLVDYLVKKDNRAEIAAQGEPDAKKAVLTYQVLATQEISGETVSLLQVTIETGRFHQIRAQLSHMGTPILGDVKYATEHSKQVAKEAGVSMTALCANKMSFTHPVTGKKLEYKIDGENPAFAIFVR